MGEGPVGRGLGPAGRGLGPEREADEHSGKEKRTSTVGKGREGAHDPLPPKLAEDAGCQGHPYLHGQQVEAAPPHLTPFGTGSYSLPEAAGPLELGTCWTISHDPLPVSPVVST